MNLEEAKANIGAEVDLDESTKPYGDTFGAFNNDFLEMIENDKTLKITGTGAKNVFITHKSSNITGDFLIEAKHLKLKPQNYKIHVPTEEESKEAQRLFFELGAVLGNGDKHAVLVPNIIGLAVIDGLINFVFNDIVMKDINARKITIQHLRDMIAKKKDEDKTVQVAGTFQNFETRKEMTWEDALDAFKGGKEVEVKNISWFNIKDLKLENIKRGTAFRIAPQRITLNGEYTKEELLQKIGEME